MSKDRHTLVPPPPDADLLEPAAEPATEPVSEAPDEEPPVHAPPAEPAAAPAPEVLPDPFARAKAALAGARAARGDDSTDDEAPVLHAPLATDPLGRAQAALEAARAARGHGAPTQRKLEDAMVEAELRRLKRAQGLDEED